MDFKQRETTTPVLNVQEQQRTKKSKITKLKKKKQQVKDSTYQKLFQLKNVTPNPSILLKRGKCFAKPSPFTYLTIPFVVHFAGDAAA